MWNKKGFTLVELLVVISIIALLLSILMPSLSAARESAKKIACASNLKSLGIACVGYGTENRNELPGPMNYVYSYLDNYGDGSNPDMWGASNTGFLYKQIFSYLGNNTKALYCPSQRLWTHKMANDSLSPSYYKYVYNYCYWGGVRFHSNGIYEVSNLTTKEDMRSIPTKLTDKGTWLLAQDIIITNPGPGKPITTDITNHMGKKSGANCLYLDGHTTWLDKSRIQYVYCTNFLLPGITPKRGAPTTPWP